MTSRLPVQCRRRATGRQLQRLRAVLVAGAASVLAVVCVSGCSRGSDNRLSSGSTAGHATAGTVPLAVLTRDTNGGTGDIFIAPAGGGYPAGPEIVTTAGKVVWFHRLPAGDVATDFRTQTYLASRSSPGSSPGGLRAQQARQARQAKTARAVLAEPTTSTTAIISRSPPSGRATGTRPTSMSFSSPPGTPP